MRTSQVSNVVSSILGQLIADRFDQARNSDARVPSPLSVAFDYLYDAPVACSDNLAGCFALGRRLISIDPEADREEIDGGEEAVSAFVILGRQASDILEFSKEALDEVAIAVEEGAEGEALSAIALCWDIGETARALMRWRMATLS